MRLFATIKSIARHIHTACLSGYEEEFYGLAKILSTAHKLRSIGTDDLILRLVELLRESDLTAEKMQERDNIAAEVVSRRWCSPQLIAKKFTSRFYPRAASNLISIGSMGIILMFWRLPGMWDLPSSSGIPDTCGHRVRSAGVAPCGRDTSMSCGPRNQ
jgi:hypothetical protein